MNTNTTMRFIWPFGTLVASATLLLFAPFLASAVITTDLDIGDNNAEVTELQGFLAAKPTLYPEGLITGYFGPLTAAAVQRYQCQKGIVCSGSAASTGYGRIGPQTRASINLELTGMPGTGGSASDVFAPVMTSQAVTLGAAGTNPMTVMINWNTNEAARSRVLYSTTWPFLYATALSASDTSFGIDSIVTLTNLAPSTTYYFVRESTDASGNVMWDIGNTFRTNP